MNSGDRDTSRCIYYISDTMQCDDCSCNNLIIFSFSLEIPKEFIFVFFPSSLSAITSLVVFIHRMYKLK